MFPQQHLFLNSKHISFIFFYSKHFFYNWILTKGSITHTYIFQAHQYFNNEITTGPKVVYRLHTKDDSYFIMLTFLLKWCFKFLNLITDVAIPYSHSLPTVVPESGRLMKIKPWWVNYCIIYIVMHSIIIIRAKRDYIYNSSLICHWKCSIT